MFSEECLMFSEEEIGLKIKTESRKTNNHKTRKNSWNVKKKDDNRCLYKRNNRKVAH